MKLLHYINLKPSEFKYLKYDDVKYKNRDTYLKIYRKSNSMYVYYKLNEDMLNIINKLKKTNEMNKIERSEQRADLTGGKLTANYIFPGGKNYVNSVLSKKFNNGVPDFQQTSATILQACKKPKFEAYDLFTPDFDNDDSDKDEDKMFKQRKLIKLNDTKDKQ